MNTSRCTSSEQGSAIILVLWFFVSVSMMLTVALNSTRISVKKVDLDFFAFKTEESLRSALEFSAFATANKPSNQIDGYSQSTLEINRLHIRIKPALEATRIDLNIASESIIAEFFTAQGYSRSDAQKFAARIADWRDTDNLARPNGAEHRDYVTGKNGEKIGNRPFMSINELGQVIGIPVEIIDCAQLYFTVFGERTRPTVSAIAIENNLGINHNRQQTGARKTITAELIEPTETHQFTSMAGVYRITSEADNPFEWIVHFNPDINRRVETC